VPVRDEPFGLYGGYPPSRARTRRGAGVANTVFADREMRKYVNG
jgi:hypothetical protein